jgi:hypothetical protein
MAKDTCTEKTRLCKLMKKHDLNGVARLSLEPKFICAKCGRVAHCKKHLCEPEKIKA